MMTTKKLVVLMADDDEEDRLLMRAAAQEYSIEIRMVHDGSELMEYLHGLGSYQNRIQFPRPDLILLDLNMPKKDGRQALREIKADASLRSIPVVMLTTSGDQYDINECYDLGANSYLIKPAIFDRLVQKIAVLHRYWSDVSALPNIETPKGCIMDRHFARNQSM